MKTNSVADITHRELCIATAKRFNDKFALYEYKSFASLDENPDVLIFESSSTVLFEIKMTVADFMADRKKTARKKYKLHWSVQSLENYYRNNKNAMRQLFRIKKDSCNLFYIEDSHLGNERYYVCPFGLIPIEKLPEGWGLYYYKNGKFYQKRKSENFRSNLRKENALAVHALRRFASGDSTGILVNTYDRRIKNHGSNEV